MLAEIAAGAVLAPAAAYAAHQCAAHYAHLAVLRALHAPVDVPPARPGSWWHGLTRPCQAVMIAALAVAGAMCGLAWVLSPVAAAASVSTALAALAVSAGIRSAVKRQQ